MDVLKWKVKHKLASQLPILKDYYYSLDHVKQGVGRAQIPPEATLECRVQDYAIHINVSYTFLEPVQHHTISYHLPIGQFFEFGHQQPGYSGPQKGGHPVHIPQHATPQQKGQHEVENALCTCVKLKKVANQQK